MNQLTASIEAEVLPVSPILTHVSILSCILFMYLKYNICMFQWSCAAWYSVTFFLRSVATLLEFENLDSFLQRCNKKKEKERQDRLQPRITNFFTHIKEEAYDGDDEATPNKDHAHPCTSSDISKVSNNTLAEAHGNLMRSYEDPPTSSTVTTQTQTEYVDTDKMTQGKNTLVVTADQSTNTDSPKAEKLTADKMTEMESDITKLPPSPPPAIQHVSTAEKSTEMHNNIATLIPTDAENKPSVITEEKGSETGDTITQVLLLDKVHLVSGMETWGTQTDIVELQSMCPIIPKTIETNLADVNTSPRDNISESDSVISSESKMEDKSKQPRAGLDMHCGEYYESTFPPVIS